MSNKTLMHRSLQKEKQALRGKKGGGSVSNSPPRSIHVSSKTGITAPVSGELVKIKLRDLAAVYPTQEVSMVYLDRGIGEGHQEGSGWLLLQEELPSRAVEKAVDTSQSRSQQDVMTDDDTYDLQKVIEISGVSGRTSVHAMEVSKRLLGLLPPGRIRGKRYPKWQFQTGIVGLPLTRILLKLESVDAWGKYQFFVSSYPELGNLTPIEVLTGQVSREVKATDETRALVQAPHDQRVRLIEEIAEGFAHPS